MTPNETPASLMTIIKNGCNKLDLGLQDGDFDRCHRNGASYSKNGSKHQIILLKLCSWRARDILYQNRKLFPFSVNHDLTKRRHGILKYVRETIENTESVSNVIGYVFADKNCKLKCKDKNDKFYGFSTKEEFLTLVDKISSEQMGDAFIEDESKNELYY